MGRSGYKRVLLKLSGEQLAGKSSQGIDTKFVGWLAQEIIKAVKNDIQVAVVVGGGNFVRGAQFADAGMERSQADYMGMLATIMNGMALTDFLEQQSQPTRLATRLQAASVAEPYIRRRVLRHLDKGRVVIIAGGTGNPYVTTDTAAVLAASELDCDVVLKATKVDGVYDKDPAKHSDARRFDKLTLQEALEKPGVKVMDKTALAMAHEQQMPIIVFDLLTEGNVANAASGKNVGTLVS